MHSLLRLDLYRDEIKGKTVVCTLSGGNNDIDRMQEMKERSLIYEGLKHYFIIEFPRRSGALREFLDKGLGQKMTLRALSILRNIIKKMVQH